LAVLALTIGQLALAKDFKLHGRVVSHGTASPIEKALVQVFDSCPDVAPSESTSKELAKATTDKKGAYQLQLATELPSACVFSRENHHMAARRQTTLSSVDIDVGDLALKPLKTGVVNLYGFASEYFLLGPEEQKALMKDVTASASTDPKNVKTIEMQYKKDRTFRQILEIFCASEGGGCRAFAGEISTWKAAVFNDKGPQPKKPNL